MRSRSDDDLVEAFSTCGSEPEFRELYRRHTPTLYRIAWRMLGGDRGDAGDAVQETWLRASQKLSRFRRRASFRTWLVGIAINVCRELIRARTRNPQAGVAREVAGVNSSRELRLDLESAVAGLPTRAREVLVLHDIEGFTHQEIGELLGTEPGTSKSQLSRARSLLRASLGAKEKT